eukprot:gene928-biopygen1934
MQRQSCTYTANYCEENVYHLLKQLLLNGKDPGQLLCCFISNRNETVIVLEHEAPSVLVWDLDTTLPFPASFEQYALQALQTQLQLQPAFQRFYRLISAVAYLQHFASDRSHMREADGSWMAAPPAYPCIQAADGCSNNLHCYREMSDCSLSAAVQGRGWQAVHNRAASDNFGIVIDEARLLWCLEQHMGLENDKQLDELGEENWAAAPTLTQAGA